MAKRKKRAAGDAPKPKKHKKKNSAAPQIDATTPPTPEMVAHAHYFILGRPPGPKLLQRGLKFRTASQLRLSLLKSSRSDVAQAQSGLAGDPVFFLHIPKTAGTILKWYFRNVARERCKFYRSVKEIDPETDASNYRVVGGHIAFKDVPAAFLEKRPVFISLLREPLARSLSLYHYLLRNSKHPEHLGIAGRTLFDAVSQPSEFRRLCDRVQLRRLANVDDAERALTVLGQHRFIVGKQEQMADFMAALHDTLGFPYWAGDTKTANIATPDYRAEIAAQPRYADAVAILDEMNAEETKFYNAFVKVWSNVTP